LQEREFLSGEILSLDARRQADPMEDAAARLLICVNDDGDRAKYLGSLCQAEQVMPPFDDHQVPGEPSPGDEPTPDQEPTPDDNPVPDHNPVEKSKD
jgi:hypothetical protein